MHGGYKYSKERLIGIEKMGDDMRSSVLSEVLMYVSGTPLR